MTTFQAIVYAIVDGFAQFLPVSANAHQALVAWLFQWPDPSEIFRGILALGAALSVLVYFRHDWASIFSCFLQVLVFRKKPMTLDERLPIFLLLAVAPTIGVWYYFHDQILEWSSHPLRIAAGLAIGAGVLWILDRWSRRNKGMFDWNLVDALAVGVGQALMFLPGVGGPAGNLAASSVRNYNREAAAKFMLYVSLPILAGKTYMSLREFSLHSSPPAPDLSWMSLAVALVVTFFTGLLAIGGLMKHVQRKGMGEYAIYRTLIAVIVVIVYWARNR
jgi:undecaprenyl-diphosphatase